MENDVSKKIKSLTKSLSKSEGETLKKGYDFMMKYHKGQKRKSGLPYVIHLMEVALDLWERYEDLDLTIAGLLHDSVEDCEDLEIEDIEKEFGESISFLVDSVNKHENGFLLYPEINFEDKIERFIWAGMKDIRVILLKLADRQNNLESLEHLQDNKQVRMAFETQAVFLPLKRILHYDKRISLKDSEKLFKKYTSKFKNVSDIKANLLTDSFTKVDNEMFGLIYKNSDSVVWKIHSMELYKDICNTENLEGKINFISVSGNKNWFEASFQFNKGAVVDEDMGKMEVGTYKK